ncbi:nitric oxide reductase activation protein [Mycolicibacterium aromaticivorans JS19b1 = JCM 16368]|uniref:Nitric oxide reductase activation protein n=2 Tax=Mycolicibacterium aromaticivorans TaxID=318425 RepID=A0A064CBU0_9MYCO|nr:nitric oxide reductase activation protein [Mycolicibacterium aromaticivorans JS19b1 = JCM 16368]
MVDNERLARLALMASALAGRTVVVAPAEPGSPSWTDGQRIFVDPGGDRCAIIDAIAVQASLIAAGSLDAEIVRALGRKTRLVARYLAVEGRRAVLANADVLPGVLASPATPAVAGGSQSASESLAIARGSAPIVEAPPHFGEIRPKQVLETIRRGAKETDYDSVGHIPRRDGVAEIEALDDGELITAADGPDLFSSPVGGGGFLGRWLKKMLSSTRAGSSGGGPPGADSPTHCANVSTRGAHAVSSTASAATEDGADADASGMTYPEWDVNHMRYRPNWCTVREVEPRVEPDASAAIADAVALRRPLARLGMGLHRRHRQPQGDEIDIDAAVSARVEVRAGSVPDESVYLDSLRRRRDLSVLVLLDVSGSSAEAGTLGKTVHEQQRRAAADLVVALNDLGDRVALYAYNSQGRNAVNVMPIKRMDDHLDTRVLRKLNSVEPVAYSRLGAAIRHGTRVLEERGGTPRRLLVVLSDGLAYDHGYERGYGAADARRALTEARRSGTGCVCLTVGASVDSAELRRVFGSAAHAVVSRPEQLHGVVGPLFRSAVRAAEARRRVPAARA